MTFRPPLITAYRQAACWRPVFGTTGLFRPALNAFQACRQSFFCAGKPSGVLCQKHALPAWGRRLALSCSPCLWLHLSMTQQDAYSGPYMTNCSGSCLDWSGTLKREEREERKPAMFVPMDIQNRLSMPPPILGWAGDCWHLAEGQTTTLWEETAEPTHLPATSAQAVNWRRSLQRTGPTSPPGNHGTWPAVSAAWRGPVSNGTAGAGDIRCGFYVTLGGNLSNARAGSRRIAARRGRDPGTGRSV